MRILQVVPCFYPAWAYGGSVRGAYELSKELIKRGHDVTVYTTDAFTENSRQKSRFLNLNGIKVHYFKNISNTLAYGHKIFLSPGMLSVVKKEIGRFDMIHLHDYRTFQNTVVHHYAKKYGIRYVLQAHGTLPRIIAKQLLKKLYDMFWGYKLLGDADGIIDI
jgi:glycosyltransferase involved in cell wall biosynthesis